MNKPIYLRLFDLNIAIKYLHRKIMPGINKFTTGLRPVLENFGPLGLEEPSSKSPKVGDITQHRSKACA